MLTEPRLSITSTTHQLPFGQLSPSDFERLCLALLSRLDFSPQHFGAAGGEQGRDIVASRDGDLWYVQCKRVKECGPKILLDELDKIEGLIAQDASKRPVGMLFIASCNVSPDARDRATRRCAELELECEIWGGTDLDVRLGPYPDIVQKFFALPRRTDGVPFQAPPLPAHFVPRLEVSEAVKAALLADDRAPGVLVVGAIQGLGGIGKSVLAAVLAHHPQVRASFPDGVLWVTLGQEPETLPCLQDWIQSLGDCQFHPTTVGGASAHLRTLLHDKACLLVVDDAWHADDVWPFLGGGDRCRAMITTRDAGLARKVGARLYDLGVMTEAQALALFEARLGSLTQRAREQAAALARELGYLPLAVELAAAQVEGGCAWQDLLDAFRQRLADLAVLDLDEASLRNDSLRLSLRLSLAQLSEEDYQAFAWLGVLAEDARLDPALAAVLWDQSEAAAHKRLLRLRDRALLRLAGDNVYIIHDLLHDEAQLRLAEQVSLTEAHAALLARCRARAYDGLWHTLLDDGYIHDHLVWHMEQAGWENRIHAMLQVETAAGRNAWYEAREHLGQTGGYLSDVSRAWRLAEDRVVGAGGVGLTCRYALVMTSLISLAGNIAPELLAVLVGEGILTSSQGLAYAGQIPDPERRAWALVGLGPHLSPGLLADALIAARAIRDERWRAVALAGLEPCLSVGQRKEVLEGVPAAARAIGNEKAQAEALAGLGQHLSVGQRAEVLREALVAARAIRDEEAQARALVGLAPCLPEDRRTEALGEALAAVQVIQNETSRAQALAELGPHLSVRQRAEVLGEALAAVRGISDEKARAQALVELELYLPEELLGEALNIVRVIDDEEARAQALVGLGPHLPEELLGEALDIVRVIDDEEARAQALAGLGSHLPGGLLEEALTFARAIGNQKARADALAGLVPYLQAVRALASVQAIQFEGARADALARLGPHLPEDLLGNALSVARAIKNEKARVDALTGLVPRLPEGHRVEVLEEALAAAQDIRYEGDRAEALAGLAPLLPEELLGEALVAVRAIGDERYRAEALAELGPHLPETQRLGVLNEALAAARTIEDQEDRAQALMGLGEALAAIPLASLGWLWNETLRDLATRTREHLLSDLRALVQVLTALGGELAVDETFRAIQDVGRWWP